MSLLPFMPGNLRGVRWVILPALAIVAFLLYFSIPLLPDASLYASSEKHVEHASYTPVPPSELPSTPHPIDNLIRNAQDEFSHLVSKKTHDLVSAAQAYREARGRHPPPGFDVWHDAARSHNVVMVEEFWDRIYDDLRPFWAIPANQIRADARANDMVINIKGGQAVANTEWFWHRIWAQMIGTVSRYLPDMVVPCNAMDEPRLLVPWETINGYLETERASRRMTAAANTSDGYHDWGKEDEDTSVEATTVEWKGQSCLSLVRLACHPESRIRRVNHVSEESRSQYTPAHMLDGFVANYTLSTSVCDQPDLGIHHGALNLPITASWSQKLIPMFGGSKLAVNNEILLPAPMPWTEDARFSAGEGADTDWASKNSQAMWRGVATGGRHHPANWQQFHRHRFVYLTNGTKLRTADELHDRILTPLFMQAASSPLSRPTREHLAEYVTSTQDVGFTNLFCDEGGEDGSCWYLDDDFSIVPQVPMSDQFNYKYLPDVDGNSFSGRYRAFLLSTSLPIKATIYREWHDSRLVAWKHFVPMDNRFTDYYGILEYFRGFGGSDGSEAVPGHDEAAQKIAYEGREWANRVLRKEDMQFYVFRLLLEYARLCDDDRDNLGFVGDLQEKK